MNLELFLAIGGFVFALVAGYWALARLVVAQFEKRLDERFLVQETARKEGRKAWELRFATVEAQQRELDRDFLKLKADLPIAYVRREDAVRDQTIINAKLDALNARLDLLIQEQARK